MKKTMNKDIKDEYRSLLIQLSNIDEKIIELDSERNQLDHARLQMEVKYNLDPKDFVTERINGKDYYVKV